MKMMDSRGQVSVEYLLMFLVVITIFSSITIPMISNSLSSSNTISIASDASIAVDTLASAVDTVYNNGPMAKRTISVYIPVDTTLITGNTTIKLNVASYIGKNVSTNTSFPIQNQTIAVTKGWHTIVVSFPVGQKFVSYTIT
jgi:uncharacterized protein (UPF0333 family)